MLPGKSSLIENHRALLSVRGLRKYFPVKGGLLQRTVAYVRAVDGVSFDIFPGETFGLVGESGCGKTTTGRAILQLVSPDKGEIFFDGKNVLKTKGHDLKVLRRQMQIIFQDPYGSLDPRIPIGEIIGEPLLVHGMKNRSERERTVAEILEMVGLRSQHMRRYPHEFSGGQRQRIGIARALVLKPRFLVCDEPVSALDVSIQSQILNLLRDIQSNLGLTIFFIAHNLAVVKYMSNRIGVMYLGKVVEIAGSDELYADPKHPYTRALLSAIPSADPSKRQERQVLSGEVPSPIDPPSGCRFHPRCSFAIDICCRNEPELISAQVDHLVACHVFR